VSTRIGHRILSTLVCTLFLVSIAAAHNVTIGQRAKVGNGPELEQGTYQVEVEKNQDSAEVLFFQGEELVVTARATLTKENAKSNVTEVHYDQVDGGWVITKIRLAGSKEGLVFIQDTPEAQ